MTGVAKQKAKRKAVESQLIADSLRLKCCAELLETGAKVIQSQETMMFRRTS